MFAAGAFLLSVRGRVFFLCCGCGGALFFVAAGAVGARFFLLRVRWGRVFFFCCGCGGGAFFFVAAGAGAFLLFSVYFAMKTSLVSVF